PAAEVLIALVGEHERRGRMTSKHRSYRFASLRSELEHARARRQLQTPIDAGDRPLRGGGRRTAAGRERRHEHDNHERCSARANQDAVYDLMNPSRRPASGDQSLLGALSMSQPCPAPAGRTISRLFGLPARRYTERMSATLT